MAVDAYLYNIGWPWGGIQEYIARDVNNIARVIIFIHIGLCVSSYYLTIVGDCRLPFCHRMKAKACGIATVTKVGGA